ncbi:MAG: MFS transporter [Caldilineaceae bacterium]
MQRLHSRWQDYFDLGVIGLTHGLSDGFSSLLKPVLALIVVDLGLSTFDAGVLLSVFSVSTFLFLYPLSLLADYSGQKKTILLMGMGLAAAAYFAMQWTTTFVALSALAFLAGAGNAVYHPCGTALTAERFAHRRAFAISFHSMMGNLGASMMPVAQAAVAMAAGWRMAVAVCTLPAAILLPLVGLRFANSAPSLQQGPAAGRQERLRQITALVVGNRSVVLLAIVYALTGMGTGVLTGFLALLAVAKFNLSTAAIGAALTTYYVAGVFAKPLMGYLYNRHGARLALLIPLLLCGALTICVAYAPWVWLFMLAVALVGTASPISPIILTAAADHSDKEALASSVGLIYTCYGLSFLSPLVGGWLAEQYGLPVSYLFAALLIWLGAGVALLLESAKAASRKVVERRAAS